MNGAFTDHVLKYAAQGMHLDGRKIHDLRELTIEYGISKSAEGSARVRLGQTEVIAGVKLDVEKPYPDTPENGNLAVNVELLALSSPDFETGPPSNQANEIARVVDRGIRESKAIDTKKLCITPHEKVWSVMIDVCTMNDAGNLLDACAIAAMAALQDAKLPGFDGKAVQYDVKSDKPVPLDSVPVSVTVYKIGKHFIIDPDTDEEKVSEARLTVASKEDGTLCAFQKGGDAPLSSEDICQMVDIALDTAEKIRPQLQR